MHMKPRQSIVLITGAGSGIGRELARTLAREGYAIAALDVCEEGLRSLADELQERQQRIAWARADVIDPPGLQQAVRALEDQLGPIDVLVANAGIGTETSGLNYNIEVMNRVLNVNLLGVSNSIGAVLPGMIQRKSGHLVAISSIASYRGLPKMLAYCASKAGVNAIMDGLRVELAPHGIHVTTVCPGWIRTALTDQIAGKLDHIMDADVAATEIAYAIRNKLTFYTFPGRMRWSLRLLIALPRPMQDWYISRLMGRIGMKKVEEAPG
jgi:NAD(P)-dependent dehydrogenase (short-subunit alcohol dehydrogenase family)